MSWRFTISISVLFKAAYFLYHHQNSLFQNPAVNELNTENIIQRLKDGRIDAGILVTPLNDMSINEAPIFYEEMIAYVSKKNTAYAKNHVSPKDIDPDKLWLLEEGHCFRSQIMNLCDLRYKSQEGRRFEYEAGSFETFLAS